MKTDRKNIIGKILVVALEHIRIVADAEDKDDVPVENDIELAEYLLQNQGKSNGLAVSDREFVILTDMNIDQWIEYYWKSAYMHIKYDGNSPDDTRITVPWLIFPSGTKVCDIFSWADTCNSKGVEYLQKLSNWLF